MKYNRDTTHACRRPSGHQLHFSRIRSPSVKLLLSGHFLMLLALCDYAPRLAAGSVEHLLYLEAFIGSISSALILLWSAGLGLDYLDCYQRKNSK